VLTGGMVFVRKVTIIEKEEIRARFADFIIRTDYNALPADIIHYAKRCILDFLGVALAGGSFGAGKLITSVISTMGGKEEATIIGDGMQIPALNAALLNGVRGHTLDMDDGHRYANAHPGVAVIPAALAVAEKEDMSGEDLIESIVVGYETMIRIATAINPSHLQRGFHTTGTAGPFGAAAACSKLLDFNKGEIENALSIAGLQGAGLLEALTSGQMMKPLHPGKAAQAGVLASLLAQKGAEGPELIFEGEKGFFRAFSDVKDFGKLIDDLGSDFEIENTYFKMYASCRHVHPTLDALKAIIEEHEIELDEIEHINVSTYSVAYKFTGQNNRAETELAAKFSLPVSIGLMVVFGRAGVNEFSLKNIGNPSVQKIADKVTIEVDEARDEVYPKKRGSSVSVRTGQKTYMHEVDIPKGEPENPWTDDEISEKFFSNAGKVLPEEKVVDLHRHIFDIEHVSARELMGHVW
jgi:2-methylcitrate dehydratase PrpD